MPPVEPDRWHQVLLRIEIERCVSALLRVRFEGPKQYLSDSLPAMLHAHIEPLDLTAAFKLRQAPQRNASDYVSAGLRQPDTSAIDKVLLLELTTIIACHHTDIIVVVRD